MNTLLVTMSILPVLDRACVMGKLQDVSFCSAKRVASSDLVEFGVGMGPRACDGAVWFWLLERVASSDLVEFGVGMGPRACDGAVWFWLLEGTDVFASCEQSNYLI